MPKPTEALSVGAFISILDEICAFVVFDDFLRGFAVPNRPYAPLPLAFSQACATTSRPAPLRRYSHNANLPEN